MIAIETTQELNYDSRNPALVGKVRIEIKSVRREPEQRSYFMHIVDSAIYKYNQEVPKYIEQEVEVPLFDEEDNPVYILDNEGNPVLDENENPIQETTTEIQMVQDGTETVEREAIRVIKENKNYPVPYAMALQLEQAVLAMFPPDPSIQGGDLRDYITRYGLYILTTQLEEVPTYNVPSDGWIII